jgi:hypothetical protein
MRPSLLRDKFLTAAGSGLEWSFWLSRANSPKESFGLDAGQIPSAVRTFVLTVTTKGLE